MAALLLLLPGLAFAGDEGVASVSQPVAGRPVFDLRVGVDTVSRGALPMLCAEAAPLDRLSLEACGTGAGVLFDAPIAEMAHFRARAEVLSHEQGRLDAGLLLGLGFAEVQVGQDAPGFRFGPAQEARPGEARPVEAAGPEASASLKARWWVDPRAYVVMDLNVGAAHIPAAPAVTGSGGPVVGFGGLSVGLGF